MYTTRIEELKKYMQKRNIEIAFITSPINVLYFTGFYSDPMERFYGLVISLEKETNLLFVPELDMQSATEANLDCTVIPITDSDNPYEKLQQQIGNEFSQFGLEKGQITIRELESLEAYLPKVRYLDVEEAIMKLRMIKTPEEVEHVQHAISITDQALENLFEKPVIGRTEKELSLELQTHIRNLGAHRPASPLVLSGKRSALPHGGPSDKVVVDGDFLLIDISAVINGYFSDVTRTFIVGKPTEEQERIYDTVLQANERAIDQIKIGEKWSAIDLAARNHIKDAGYGPYFNHRIGHGLGLEIHETPSIHERNEDTVLPGMLITIEPGIYIPDIGGVRIEDDIYITLDGEVTILSSMSKKPTYIH